MSKSDNISRRRFLGQASCAAVGSSALFSTLLNLRLMGTAAAAVPTTDYRAVVCLFLFGGNDSYNMLVPRGSSSGSAEYTEYANIRRDLAIPYSSLLPINPLNPDGRGFGVHPGMPEIQSLFESGRLAFITNVGTLIRPMNITDYRNNLYRPLGLYSHADQQQQWHTCLPDKRTNIGWGGRAADLLKSLNTQNSVSMNISLSGVNIFQTGQSVLSYAVDPTGATVLTGNTATTGVDGFRNAAIRSQLDLEYKNLFERTFTGNTRTALDANSVFNTATSSVTLNTPFPSNPVADRLKMIAKIIGGRSALGAKRQTFFVGWGGFDFHDNVIGNMSTMMPQLSQSVKAFDDAMRELGISDKVTLFLASDFGRTLTSNGAGSDHGWGGNVFAVGGAVNGKRIFGTYPSLAAGSSLDCGQGRLLPQISVDAYAAELALWLGVLPGDLPTVLPNVRNFYAGPGSPIGFLPPP